MPIISKVLLFITILITILYCWYIIESRPPILWVPENVHLGPWHFAILTWGSRGDIEPMIALGIQLQEKGHNVTITIRNKYHFLVPASIAGYIMPEDGTEEIIKSLMSLSPAEHGLFINKYWGQLAPVWLKEWANIQGVDAFIASSYLHVPAFQFAKSQQKPIFGINFLPAYPTMYFMDLWMTEGMIVKSWSLVNWISHLPSQLLQSFYMPSYGKPSFFERLAFSREAWRSYPQFFLNPTQMFEIPIDSPSWFHFTGPFFYNRPASSDLKLQNFLHKNPEPLYLGFGSMEGYNITKSTIIFSKALLQTNKKSILLGKSFDSSILKKYLPEDSFFMGDNFHHQSLFPKMKAIIHHGGAGHVFQTCLARKPSIIISFFLEHRIWATQTEKFGSLSVSLNHLLNNEQKGVDHVVNLITQVYQNTTLEELASNCEIANDGAQKAALEILQYMKNFNFKQNH